MKKKIILFLLLTSALFIGLNEAKATIAGTCVCYSPSTLQTMEKDCNTWQTDNKMSDNDVLNYNNVETGENACDKICTSTGVYQWAASTGMIGKKGNYVFKDAIGNKWKDEWTKGCYKTESNPNASTNNCETTYTEADCKKQSNTVWDSDKKCCNLKEVCWYYGYGSSASEGGTMVWSKKSPCTDENKKKHPDQTCHVVKEFDMELCKSKEGKNTSIGKIDEEIKKITDIEIPEGPIKENTMKCEELIGENLHKIVKLIITLLRIVGAIIAIVNGMITLIPAVISKDAEALKSAEKKCITMAIVLVLIILLPTLLIFLSNIFGYDLSCIV